MIVQHNISALNSHRNLGINNKFTSKNLEKLSSGYRINRAGDDAAGLAISEKMRGQIRGLAMAEQNTSHGINLIQTAEGALNETHAILQRMRELAVQSSNGTYDESVDRAQLDKEFQTIKSEIDRIADSTHYNGIKLIDGSLELKEVFGSAVPSASDVTLAAADVLKAITTTDSATVTHIGAPTSAANYKDASVSFSLSESGQLVVKSGTGASNVQFGDGTLTFNVGDENDSTAHFEVVLGGFDENRIKDILAGSKEGVITINLPTGVAGTKTVTMANDITSRQTDGADHTALKTLGLAITADTATTQIYGKQDVKIKQLGTNSYEVTVGNQSVVDTFDNIKTNGVKLGGLKVTIGTDGEVPFKQMIGKYGEVAMKDVYLVEDKTMTTAVDKAKGTKDVAYAVDFSRASGAVANELVFQIGANGGQDQRVGLSVAAMDSQHLGMRKGETWEDGNVLEKDYLLADVSIDTIDNANKAIEVITAATNQVSSVRADLGALQNRLEHTMNNLGVTKENLTAAESTIRDVDMAKEMMDFTKNNILVQASQAMLAQANQLPQGVLQLLR